MARQHALGAVQAREERVLDWPLYFTLELSGKAFASQRIGLGECTGQDFSLANLGILRLRGWPN